MSVAPTDLCPVLVLATLWGLASVHPLQLLPDMQEDIVEFELFKCKDLEKPDQYQWQLTDRNVLPSAQLYVSYQGEGDSVQLHDQGGNLLGSVDLCRSAYYIVIKFSWSNKTYRYPTIICCMLLCQ